MLPGVAGPYTVRVDDTVNRINNAVVKTGVANDELFVAIAQMVLRHPHVVPATGVCYCDFWAVHLQFLSSRR